MLDSILPIPDLIQAKRVLAIQPHYDDNDIGAGGTLAKLSAGGTEIFYLTVTDDQMGVLDANLSYEDADRLLKDEQEKSGKIIGVREQFWLGYPDAGVYDPYELCYQIVKNIRLLKPDFIFTPDPWLTYEAHQDHVKTGLAVAFASLLYNLPRLKIDATIDKAFQTYELSGLAFYYTREPNVIVDISSGKTKKEQAVRCYQAQFSPHDLDQLIMVLEAKSAATGEPKGFQAGEGFKVLHPLQLHCGL